MKDEYKVFAHFVGIVKKIQTLSGGDGDYRITIDIPASCKMSVKELMDYQDKLCAFAVAKAQKPKEDHETFEEF